MVHVFAKPALTYQQQIAHLAANGMVIPDHAAAEFWLRHVSYYRLSAYWLYFERPKGSPGPRFQSGTTFERVTRLYDFDRLLRRLVMRGTQRSFVRCVFHMHLGIRCRKVGTPVELMRRTDTDASNGCCRR